MGHWADDLLPKVKQELGISGDERDAELLALARWAQSDTELLTGHRMDSRSFDLNIDHGGLRFVATLDAQTATLRAEADCWPIADPVHPEFSNVLQVARTQNPAPHAVGRPEALRAAAAGLAALHRQGVLRLAPLLWFVEQGKNVPASELMGGLRDPANHVHVPVASGSFEGWWVQLSRRIQLVTKDTPDEPSLVEFLAPPRSGTALVAHEPVLILARMTEHPSDWVFVARIWATEGKVRPPRAWRSESQAVHAHGLPILCLDDQSTADEVVAQMLLVAYWHGYIDGDEAGVIPAALAAAFPRQVASVMGGTGAPGIEKAATLLFERLLRPGFDPTRGAGSIRRYITHHATTLVRDHRSTEAEFHGWDEFGIKERHYYKLLARFGQKAPDGTYLVGDAVKAKIRSHVDEWRQRQAAMALLRDRGFSDAATRKWRQRHTLEEVATAKPRRPRGSG